MLLLFAVGELVVVVMKHQSLDNWTTLSSSLVEKVRLQFHDANLTLPSRGLWRGIEPGTDFLALFDGGSVATALPVLFECGVGRRRRRRRNGRRRKGVKRVSKTHPKPCTAM